MYGGFAAKAFGKGSSTAFRIASSAAWSKEDNPLLLMNSYSIISPEGTIFSLIRTNKLLG